MPAWCGASRARGSFVAPLERVAARLELRDLHQDAAERGHHHEAEVLGLRAEAASADCAHALGLRRGQRVFFCQLLHREQGVPLQLESRWVLPSAAPAFLEQDFGSLTPTAYLLQVAPLTAAQYQIEAVAASPEEASCLGLGSWGTLPAGAASFAWRRRPGELGAAAAPALRAAGELHRMNSLSLYRDARLATLDGPEPWGALVENGAVLTSATAASSGWGRCRACPPSWRRASRPSTTCTTPGSPRA
jgi:hypothetical protein